MFSSFLLAAALGLNPNNKVISPGLGTRVVVRTQAFLVDSEPGEFSVEAFLNADGDVPGEKIENVGLLHILKGFCIQFLFILV